MSYPYQLPLDGLKVFTHEWSRFSSASLIVSFEAHHPYNVNKWERAGRLPSPRKTLATAKTSFYDMHHEAALLCKPERSGFIHCT